MVTADYKNINQPLNLGNSTNSSMPVNANDKEDRDKEYVTHRLKKQQALESARIQTQNAWQWAYEVIVPRKSDVITKKLAGSDRNMDLFDTTAILANEFLGGALHSMLTNMSVRFFDLVPSDFHAQIDDAGQKWLQATANKIYSVLNESNFQTEIHEIYLDLGAIGTSCLYIGAHDERVVHFNARAMKEIYCEENNLGLIDTVHRKFMWKIRQIVQEFGLKDLPEELQRAYEKEDEKEYEIIHCVHEYTKQEKEDKVAGSNFFKFRSTYILKDRELLLSDKGYHEFPYCVPRWTKTTGEVYGRGPGTNMLPDILMVNEMMRTLLDGAQKAVNPPFAVTDNGIIGNLKLSPGGVTVVRAFADSPIKPLLAQNPQIDFGPKMVEDVRNRIRSGFYVDQLQLREQPGMTATEVMQQTEEKMRIMGPVLGRQEFELLRPLIERVYPIMYRKGLIPPPPPSLRGRPLGVRYTSLIARAQRMSEGQNIARAISVAAPITQANPNSVEVLDADKAVKYIFDVYGVPKSVMRTDIELSQIKKQHLQQQQQAMQQQQQQHQADLVSKIAPGAAQLQQAQQQQGNQT